MPVDQSIDEHGPSDAGSNRNMESPGIKQDRSAIRTHKDRPSSVTSRSERSLPSVATDLSGGSYCHLPSGDQTENSADILSHERGALKEASYDPNTSKQSRQSWKSMQRDVSEKAIIMSPSDTELDGKPIKNLVQPESPLRILRQFGGSPTKIQHHDLKVTMTSETTLSLPNVKSRTEHGSNGSASIRHRLQLHPLPELPDQTPSTPSIGQQPRKQGELLVSSESFIHSKRPSLLSSARPRLTLSAFRRPENTVRIADLDPSREISCYYDLHAPECRILGHGAFSTVRLAIRRCDNVKVAVKSIAKHEALRARRLRCDERRHDEWEILRSLKNNPNVVSLLDVFETDEEIQLVMEYCNGGELFDVIKRQKSNSTPTRQGSYAMSEHRASSIMSQILSALVDLHVRGIVHRDVKPENILLMRTNDHEMSAKLSDFGTAKVLQKEGDDGSSSSDGDISPFTPVHRRRAYSTVGSDYYAAPEVCAGGGYGTAVDIYALGVTLYVLLCGFPPSFCFKKESLSVSFPGSHWKVVSEGAKRLLRKMLDPDASKRITAEQALRDDWMEQASRFEMTSRCSASRTVVDLDLVCSKLYKNVESANERGRRKRSLYSSEGSRKKSRSEDQAEAGTLIAAAMVDLYRGVASAARSVTAAAAGVMYDEVDQDVRVLDVDEGECNNDDSRTSSPFEPTLTALSV